jgi:hypothetical protein
MAQERTGADVLPGLLKQFGIDDGRGWKRAPETPAELQQFCRALCAWLGERRPRLLGSTPQGRAVLESGRGYTGVVEAVWILLRRIAGAAPYPPLNPGTYDQGSALETIDRVIRWCAAQGQDAKGADPKKGQFEQAAHPLRSTPNGSPNAPPANPFRELEKFAWQKVYEEEKARSLQRNGRPRPMHEAGPSFQERERQLLQLCNAAMTAWCGTGFPSPEVVKRVERLRKACMRVLKWEFPNLWPKSQQQTEAGAYFIQQLNRLFPAIQAVQQLAACLDGRAQGGPGQGEGAGADRNQAGTGQPEGNKGRRRRGRKPDTDPKADKRIADAWETKRFRTYAECARELRITPREVKAALDRHRKRTGSRRRKPPEAPE